MTQRPKPGHTTMRCCKHFSWSVTKKAKQKRKPLKNSTCIQKGIAPGLHGQPDMDESVEKDPIRRLLV